MKRVKILMAILLTAGFLSAFAIPSGCYEGSSRYTRDRCAIAISGNELCVTSKDGTVLVRWTIVSDKDGILSLRSEAGATARASWWKEDGEVYLNFNYETYHLR